MKLFTLRHATASVVFTASLASLGHAADVNGRIKGTVTDPQGAILPGVVVTAINQDTGVKFVTKTQSDGSYTFLQLPVGTYTVAVAASGFQAFKATGIILTIDQEYVEAVKLNVGRTSETLEVAADAVQVNTTDMQINNIVDAREMVEFPLIGRDFTQLELLEPGVQASSDRFGGNFSVSGSQTQQSEYLINGADTNDIALNDIALTPNLDALDQFNLIEGPLNAEYDRNSGGIVSASIKQGTNHVHGDAYEFYRDTFLNTPGYFQDVDGVKSTTPYHQHIFGATAGGPILKDKLFIFGAYEGQRQRSPEGSGTLTTQVYTPAQLTGNFSTDLTAGLFSTNPIPSSITVPGCTAGEAWNTCLTALNGVIPTSALNPLARSLAAKYIPAANSGSTGYQFNEVDTTTSNQILGRVDFSPTSRDQLYFIGIYQQNSTLETLPFTGATLPGFGDIDGDHIQQYTFDYVRQLSSRAVNDFAVHWTRFNFVAVEPQNTLAPSSLGFNIAPQNAAAESLPTIGIVGPTSSSANLTIGFSTNGPQPRIDQVYQIDDSFSFTAGHHQLKFGYDGRRFNVSNPFSARNSGSYSFNSTSSNYTTGDGSLDFLLGIPGSYNQGTGAVIQASAYLNYGYAQDTWKVSNNLVIDYGLGYSVDTPLNNHQYAGEGIACLISGEKSTIFPTAPAGIVYPGDPGCNEAGQAYTRHSELGPRIGFAYSPDLGRLSAGNSHKFSIRGGFGIYYNRTEEESSLQTLQTPPNGLSSNGAGDFGGTPQFANPFADINGGVSTTGTALTKASESNRFPFTNPSKGQAVDFSSLEPMEISTYDRSFRAPYAENFQLTLEREFPARLVMRLSYVGSLARHNQVAYEGNPETAAGHAACLADAGCTADRNYQAVDYPSHTAYGEIDPNTGETAFQSVGEVGSFSSSSYNALQVGIQKAPTHGLSFQMSYTYSHSLDNASSFENSGFGENGARGYNQFNQGLNYGDSAFDARNRFVFAPIYTVPIHSGKAWYSAENLLASGWQISGILTLAQGFPYDISYAGGTSRSLYCSAGTSFYACPDVPEQIAPLTRFNPRAANSGAGYTSWFSAASFAAEPIGSFGNIHRDPYHGPGLNNSNVLLAKNIAVSNDGVRRLQLRLESDNVFNHTQFENPNTTYGAGTFGTITTVQNPRQTQLGAKFYF